MNDLDCDVYIGDSTILSPYLEQGWLQRVSPLVDHADPFHVPNPILHAGGAIRRDDREIGKVGMFIALIVNPLPDVGVSYGCRNCRLLVRLSMFQVRTVDVLLYYFIILVASSSEICRKCNGSIGCRLNFNFKYHFLFLLPYSIKKLTLLKFCI